MKNSLESILQQLQSSICYYLHFSPLKTRDSFGLALAHWFYFPPYSGTLLFRLVVRLKHQFAEIYPQINKKIRFYYLGVLSIDFLFLSF